jgi:hypothetical protein
MKQAAIKAHVLPKRLLTLTRLHGGIPQKMVFFIDTAVRTANPIIFKLILKIIGC